MPDTVPSPGQRCLKQLRYCFHLSTADDEERKGFLEIVSDLHVFLKRSIDLIPRAGDAVKMSDAALRFAPPTRVLWLVAAGTRTDWRDQAALLNRAIISLARHTGVLSSLSLLASTKFPYNRSSMTVALSPCNEMQGLPACSCQLVCQT